MRFKDKVALITGASSGIGRATALRMAAEGADVVVNARDPGPIEAVVKEIEAMGRRALGISTDVSGFAECGAMIERATREFGRVDILVANAALYFNCPFDQLTEQQWDDTIRVGIKGAFNCIRQVAEQMVARRWGRIIAVSATTGLTGRPNLAHFSAAKHGLNGMVKAVAAELAPLGVTANIVTPGPMDTPAVQRVSAEIREGATRRVLMGRLGKPVEVAEACCYLASQEAGYITGAVINVSGGTYI